MPPSIFPEGSSPPADTVAADAKSATTTKSLTAEAIAQTAKRLVAEAVANAAKEEEKEKERLAAEAGSIAAKEKEEGEKRIAAEALRAVVEV